MNAFGGVWKRSHLYEPYSTGYLSDVSDDATDIVNAPTRSIVLWIQSKSGYFIDMRIPLILNESSQDERQMRMKSFAGTTEYDPSLSLFTWTRVIDYRNVSEVADVGKMTFLSNDTLQEDSVLMRDDYREIWKRVSVSNENFSCSGISILLFNGVRRKGYFLTVGDYFGICLGRDDAPIQDASIAFADFFNNNQHDSSIRKYINSYFCAIGTVSCNCSFTNTSNSWIINYCTDATYEGNHVSSLESILEGWTSNFKTSEMPFASCLPTVFKNFIKYVS